MASVMSQGLEFTWVGSGPGSGTMRIRSANAVPDVAWAAWEGCLLEAFDLTGAQGTVGPARPAADGRGCEIPVSWMSGKAAK